MTDLHEVTHDLRSLGRLGLVDAVDDTGVLQTVDVTINDGVQHTRVPVMQMAGFASVPTKGAVVLLINVGADPANMRALPIVTTWRFGNLVAGEAVLYGADGSRVACRDGGDIDIFAKSKLRIKAPAGVDIEGDVAITGNLTASGDITDGKSSMEQIRTIYDGHGHPGATSPPNQQMPE